MAVCILCAQFSQLWPHQHGKERVVERGEVKLCELLETLLCIYCMLAWYAHMCMYTCSKVKLIPINAHHTVNIARTSVILVRDTCLSNFKALTNFG